MSVTWHGACRDIKLTTWKRWDGPFRHIDRMIFCLMILAVIIR